MNQNDYRLTSQSKRRVVAPSLFSRGQFPRALFLMYTIVPKSTRPRRSPFDVPGLSKSISRQEILEAISESREGS